MATKNPKPFSVGQVKCRVLRTREAAPPWYWRAYVHTAGTKRNVWCGWATPQEARKTVAALVATQGDEAPVVAQAAAKGAVTTVRDLMETWMAWEEHQPLKAHTVDNYRRAASTLTSHYGDVVLARVDSTFRETVAHELRRAGYGNSTLGMISVVFGMAWGWGRDRGLTPNLTLPKVKLSRETSRDNESTYTPEDMWRIIDHFPAGTWMHLTARLFEATGCRPDELAHLTWANLDVDAAEIRVTISKTGSRVVPLPQSVLDFLLDGTPEADRKGRLIAGAAVATVRDGFRKHLKTACETLGIKYCPPKQIRHATADRLYRCGVDPSTAGKIMGHSPATAMTYYRKVTSTDRAKAVALAGLGERPEAATNVVALHGRKAE